MASSSSDASPTKKRARTASSTNVQDSDDWKRHPELYMSDGTMVLLAQDIVFRVYPGLLSKHSDVFGGMATLSECQPANAEIYDGCPLVRLSDNAQDLAYFLKMTMGLQHFHLNRPTPFPCVAAILRLSTKYMVTPLRQQAIEHLSRIIPRQLDEIGKKEGYSQVFGSDSSFPHPFELVSLFRQCQLTRFLPWTYYMACKEGFDALLSGGISRQSQVIHMSEEDTHIALRGWKKLRDGTLDIRRTTVMSRAPNCESGPCNDMLRMAWLDTVFHHVRSDSLEQWKPLHLLVRYQEITSGPPSLTLRGISPCPMCAAFWLKEEAQRRRKVWDDLPLTFGLPPWEILLKEEEDVGTG